jgi:predicted transcriptional regulator
MWEIRTLSGLILTFFCEKYIFMRKNQEPYKRGTTGGKVRFTEKDLEKIHDLLLQGFTQTKIAKQLGFTQAAVCEANKRFKHKADIEKQSSIEKDIINNGELFIIDIIKKDLITQIACQVKHTKNIRDLTTSLLNIIAIEKEMGGKDNSDRSEWIDNILKKLD